MRNLQARARTASMADHRGSDNLPFPETQKGDIQLSFAATSQKSKADQLTMNFLSRASTSALAGNGSGLKGRR